MLRLTEYYCKASRINKISVRVHLTDVYYILFTSRFNVDSVEHAAKNVFINLLKKQNSRQDPNTEREKERLREELRKVTKMLRRFNPQ